ncbi:GntR family transcriptional regulator [Curtobacterium sp. 24E2]|nr:GntR family transcriptional regulator [Curtobacterium sp. 24E2]
MTTSDGNALVDDLAARIRAKIMSGEIPIGAPLRQADLAAQFGISRTPVREALRQLQTGGLIEVVPNRGAVVRVPVPWEVREAYEVRAELESLAARRAVDRLDDATIAQLRSVNQAMYERSLAAAEGEQPKQREGSDNDQFHGLIYQASGNTRLTRMLVEINDAFPGTSRPWCSARTPGTARRTSASTRSSSRRSSPATASAPPSSCATTSCAPASTWRTGTSAARPPSSPADPARPAKAARETGPLSAAPTGRGRPAPPDRAAPAVYRTGARRIQPVASSIARVTASSWASRPYRPTTCTPTGSPSGVNPAAVTTTGCAVNVSRFASICHVK